MTEPGSANQKNTSVFIFEPDLIFYDIFRIIFNRVLCTSRGFSHIIWVTVMFLLHRRVFWVRNLWMMIFVPSVWCIIRSLWWGSHWKKIVVGLIWVNYFYWPSRPWPTTFLVKGKMVQMSIYTLIKRLNAVSTGFIAEFHGMRSSFNLILHKPSILLCVIVCCSEYDFNPYWNVLFW